MQLIKLSFKRALKILMTSLILLSALIGQEGFLHNVDGEIVEGNGEPILLRGFGLGGWLVPEGYMLCLLYTSPSPRDATLSRMPSSA